jgi:hypothetical protein
LKINYDRIIDEAKKMGISPLLLLKRKLMYRKTMNPRFSCSVCEHKTEFNSNLQCKIIGEYKSIHANIEPNYICNAINLKGV